MNVKRTCALLVLGASLFAGTTVFAQTSPVQNLIGLDEYFTTSAAEDEEIHPAAVDSARRCEQKVAADVVAKPEALQELVQRSASLSPRGRKNMADRLRFSIAQEGRSDLSPYLEALEKSDSTPSTLIQASRDSVSLSAENILRLPAKVGKLKVKYLLSKRSGEIHQCDHQKFSATLEDIHFEVTPLPAESDKVLFTVKIGDRTPEKIPAKLSQQGEKVTLRLDWPVHASAPVVGTISIRIISVHYSASQGKYKFYFDGIPGSMTAWYR